MKRAEHDDAVAFARLGRGHSHRLRHRSARRHFEPHRRRPLGQFDVGKAAPSFRHTFVKIAGDDRVFHASDNFRFRFESGLDELRDKTVLSFNRQDLQEIRIAQGTASVTLTRTPPPAETPPAGPPAPAAWQLADGRPADGAAVDLFRAYAKIMFWKFSLEGGKDNVQLGPGEYGLLLSSNTVPYYLVKLQTEQSLEAFRIREALNEAMGMARLGNKYLAETEPWKVIQTDPGRVATILHVGLQLTANLAGVLDPFLPQTMKTLREYLNMGSLTWAVVLIGLSALRADQLILAYLLAGLSGFGIATAYIVPWAMVPDIIEFDQAETGERREGSYYAFFSFFQKLGTGVALWGMGQALAITGYINPSQGQPLPVQPDAAVDAIRIFMGPVPAVLLVLSILFAWRVNITRESHHRMVEALKEQA